MNEIISKSPLFKGINPGEVERLLGQLLYQNKNYKKNDLIVQTGQECNALRIILSGSVKGEMMDFSGKTIKIEDIEAPKPLAVAFLFGNYNQYPVNIIANGDTSILSIPKPEVLKLMQLNQVFLQNYLNTVSNRAQFLSQKIKFLSFKTIKGKIAQFILQKAGSNSTRITLEQTQQQLAEMFGVTRPSLARTMGELDDEGIISVNRKEIEILDQEKLRALLKIAVHQNSQKKS